jgi:ABC-type multidrug transport system fused ATPase/permease subunit
MGALRSDIETVKHQGAGQLLSRVMDSQALESLALNGGFGVLVAILELAFAAVILAAGAGGHVHVLMLGVWLALTLALSWRYFRRLRVWTVKRLDMTHDLVARMVGHRTRLAQEHPARRVDYDDRTIKDYVNVSRDMDGAIAPIVGALPRDWIILALLGLAPAFVSRTTGAPDLAIALGESWHKLATEAPQFHENHVLSGTLAFNLLMGRNWPPTEEELKEAKELCGEPGLGERIERMSSGMMQMVGETGWQLSHGERSRIFLARALLQEAQLTILDESFAALDPETLEKCLNCAFERAGTLMVIAHP